MVEPTEDRLSQDLPSRAGRTFTKVAARDVLLDALVRTCGVEVTHILLEDSPEMVFRQDDHVVETLASHTAQKPLTDRIQIRGFRWDVDNVDACAFGNHAELK